MKIPPPDQIGVIVVDHGSRRDESNRMLLDVVEAFQQQSDHTIIEPAHMDLAEPSIETAYRRCVARGAKLVVIHPYFLLPGRHCYEDVPALAAAASQQHPDVPFTVTEPVGLHPLMVGIIQQRISDCLHDDSDDVPLSGPCQQ